MKDLKDFLLESVKRIVELDRLDDKELNKFAKEVATYVSAHYHLDYPFETDFVFRALSKLKGKELKLSAKDFDMYEEPQGEECLYCIPIEKYYDSDPRKGWLDI